jgi:hypothetical protein
MLSNLFAIRHMQQQEIKMWQQKTVPRWIYNDKYTTYLSNADKSCDRKTIVSTIVVNVATEMEKWLDTTELDFYFIFSSH